MRALVVGAGCCGASAARRLAEYGWQVTVVDRRDHIGGNAHDRREENGILYHVYGPHVFFTDRERVWEFLAPLARWAPFRCALRVWIEGDSHPMPFQPETLRRLLPREGEAAVSALARAFAGRDRVTVLELLNAADPLLRRAGQRLYHCDCAPYNQKQWGLRLEELSPEVIARAPVYLEERREFRPERFQFMPEEGFTALFRSMLDHPAIEVLTNREASALMAVSDGRMVWKTGRTWDAVLYTGRLDELFSGREGLLPYRTLRFDLEYRAPEEGLPCLAMYYPELDIPWTRRTDYRYLPGNPPGMGQALLVGERPGPMEAPRDEPYYVVLTEQSKARHQAYRRLLDQVPHLYAAGRLADFRYYNMDEAVERGLDAAEQLHRREGEEPVMIGNPKEFARAVRMHTAKTLMRTRDSHIGGGYSSADILAVLYTRVLGLTPDNLDAPDRNVFLLSKGHIAATFYTTLAYAGLIPMEDLELHTADGGNYAGHTRKFVVPGVEMSAGSLGHGANLGTGIAYARKLQGQGGRVFVLMGDGECNEGSVWEAAMCASRFALNNLVLIVDRNRLQSYGSDAQVLNMGDMAEKFRVFGCNAVEVNGHDYTALEDVLSRAGLDGDPRPTAVIAHTVKGRGVSFMEDRLEWHFKSPNEEQLAQALEELSR